MGTLSRDPSIVSSPGSIPPSDVIARRIDQRTSGRVHRLSVEIQSDQIVVGGHCQTYYVKQLALHAVQELCDSLPVVNTIAVGKGNARTHGRPVIGFAT